MANDNDKSQIEHNSSAELGYPKKKDNQPNLSQLKKVEAVQPNLSELVKVDKGFMGGVKDFGKSIAAGAASIPDIAIGLGDIASGGRIGKAIDDSGVYKTGSGSEYWNDQKSINAKSQQQEFQAAEGVVDKTKVALSNPSMIVNAVGESLAPMAVGGLAGRAVSVASKGAINPVVAGAIGEGTVMAGSQAESIRQETDDGLLSSGQTAAAIGTGVAGSMFGYLGGRLANKWGFGDAETMIAGGMTPQQIGQEIAQIPLSSIPKKVLQGAFTEGILEELPQSLTEQALQNVALGKDWHENLDGAAVMGALAGAAMGGGIAGYTSTQDYMNQPKPPVDNSNAPTDPNGFPQLPGPNGLDSTESVTGEFIPRDGQASQSGQERTNYEYDQFSTDADNLLATQNGDGYNPAQGSNPNNPEGPTTPPLSRQLGINPEDGPLSNAAALAVDSGATALLNAPSISDTENNIQQDPNSPLSTAAGLLNAPNENSPSIAGQESTLGSTTGDGSLGQASDTQLRETSGILSTSANGSGSDSATDSTGNNIEQPAEFSNLSNAIGNGGQDTSGGINSVNSVSGIGEPSQAPQGQSDRNNLDTFGNDSILSGENEGTATSNPSIGTITGDTQSRPIGANSESSVRDASNNGMDLQLGSNGETQAQASANANVATTAQAQPILGSDGKNKWFGNQDKAQAFIDKKNLGNDYQVVQDGKRFEIQAKAAPVQDVAAPVQAPVQAQVADLEQQLATEKSVIKKVRLRKQIAELQKDNPIEQGAHTAATSNQNDLPEPTQAQIEAGNYKKGHIKVNGLDIAVENPRGSTRSGKGPDGKEWSHTMSDHYGYIKRTTGADNEHIDTYVGPNHESDQVYVVDQVDQGTGGFDEHKVMMGFNSQDEAIKAYSSNFDKGWKVGPVTAMSQDQFKDWLKNSDTKKPISESSDTKSETQHPVNKWQDEMNKALDKADPEHPMFKKLQASAKNGLRSVSDRAAALRQAREIEKKAEAPKAEKPKAKASENTLVSDERAAELRARLKAKLSQLNSGIDPEIMAIGAELAVYHIERGARKFAALAQNIANDLDVSVDKIRPYLRSWYNGARDMMEDMGADIQGMDNAETVRAELAKLDNPQQQSNTVQGKTETVVTPSGREFEVQHKVVEANDLIVSNLDTGAVNPQFPQQLQPRDRTRMSSITQVNEMANKLNPKLLGDSSSSTNGAPIVSDSNEVESGNGRTLAIRKAYQLGKADSYKAWLQDQGYDVANMDQPVLVRERITEMSMDERVAYTKESNQRATLDLSPSEQAMSDAPKVMELLHLLKTNNFNSSVNRGFTNAFLTNVVSTNERAAMLDKDGISLTQDGYRRIESALLAAAFNDQEIITQVVENKDTEIKAIGGALLDVAPKWAEVRQGVLEGVLAKGVDISANLVEAVHLIRKARLQNKSVNELVNQDDIFSGEIDQVTKDLIKVFYSGDTLNKARSREKVTEALNNYATLALSVKSGPNLFGDAPSTGKELVGKVNDKIKQSEAEKQQDIFSGQRANDSNAGNSGEVGQRSETESGNAATSESEKGLNANEQPASSNANQQGTSEVRSGTGVTQRTDSQGSDSNVETELSRSDRNNESKAIGQSSVRDATAYVANDGGSARVGDESNGRKGTSGTTALSVEPTKLESSAGVASQAKDFFMAIPEDNVGGSQRQRFNKNKAALELLDELQSEGRQATPEEQYVLASFTGWGSFGQDLFQGTWNTPVFKDDWKDENLWLREKLGQESWESAKDSIINAFFTDPYTVKGMWSMAEKMGFTGGRVLEPAVGTGNFISLMPLHLKSRSQITAIDLDITAAAISKQLFPESNVQNMPYQKSKTPDNFYDLVISNVPFSNDVKIADRRYNQFNPNLHDYFFLKTLDQVRPGGIVMAITSSGTMDKQSEVIRRELAKKAELITSVRLPSGAFKEYAGTAVVTDIIVLRKRAQPLTMTPDENWIGLSEVKTSTKPVKVNTFYAENLRNVLGTIDYKGGDPRFAGMTVHAPSDLKQQLEKVSDLVPENALLPRHTEDHLTYYANKSGERTNTLTMSDGKLMYVYGDQMVDATELVKYELKSVKDTAARKQSIEDLVALRQTYTQLIDAERSDQDNADKIRKDLNKQYQSYVKAHGPLEKSFGLQYFKKIEDAYYYSMASLEQKGKPADILKRSVVRGKTAMDKPTISDAFVIARNQSTSPSIQQIATLANVTADQARAELLSKGAVYEMANGDVQPSDIYLSGNVRHKLEEAQSAVAEGNQAMQRNVDALKDVVPEDIPYFNIETKMGATWVPLTDYQNYVAHMLGMTDSKGIEITAPSGKWKVKLDGHIKNRMEATTNYGSKEKSFQTLVSAALSNQTITVKRRDSEGGEYVDVGATEEVNGKIAKIKEDFADWLWSDPQRRVQLEKEYNHTFNAWATPKYDGSFMSMQGMALTLGNGPFNLRQHQLNAIWRAIVNRRSINAHEVGTGKTFTMGGIAVESRRYGIAKKPLILAHNANSSAVAKEIQMMYPSARVLFISEMGKAVRQIRLRQIANDDWDVVVMPHSMIDKLTLSEETLMAMAADDIAALESELEEALAEEGGATLEEVLAMDSEALAKKLAFKSPTAKEIAKTRLNLIEKIQKQAQESSKADAVNFEDLGVDMIMVDEVHEFKKPSIATRMKMKGLNSSDNKRSVNLQLLTRYVRRMNNGGNVHTFTGTPITNTLTEIYHQMRYVMEEAMQQLNVANWDGWFGSFATDIQDIELSATGDYQLVSRLAGFVNVPELRKMIGQYMDIVFADDMPEMQPRKTQSGKLLSDPTLTESEKAELINGRTENAKDRPYKKVINVTTEMSPTQEQVLSDIQGYAKEWEAASGKQKRKWMRDGDKRAPLSISTAAKKASYDVRINDPEYVGKEGVAEDFATSKASQVVKNVMEIYQSSPLASQVIFADTGYSTSTERSTGEKDHNGKKIRKRVQIFSPIKDIVERLVQQGIPRDQIAIVDGSVKAEARKAIADKVNTGEIRVVIGLTQTLGVGVNMQKNLRAMHHLDAPWMPGELEQRNGRGLRQGNQWNTVLEYRYITDRLDGKSWQVLAIKQRFINAFMKADANVRSIEGDAAADNDGDNGGDIMSSFSEAAGDPRVLMRIQSKGKLEALQRKERLHTQGIADMQRTIGNTQRRVEHLDRQINDFKSENILVKIQDLLKAQSQLFSMKVNGTAFDKRKDAEDAIKEFIADHMRMGSEAVKFAEYAGHPLLIEWNSQDAQPKLIMRIGNQEYFANTLRGLEGQLRAAPQELDKLNSAKNSAKDTIANLQKAVKQPFAKADQLQREQKKLEDLEADLVNNPVAPPMWLRQGAPVDSEIYFNGKLFIVSGHKYTADGWFVTADDAKGTVQIPYMEATDNVGMPVYEEHEFEAPKIDDKTKKDEEKVTGTQTDEKLYSRKSGNQKTGKSIQQVRDALIKRFGKDTIESLEKQGKLKIVESSDVEGAEGFYHNGQVTLIANNLTADSIIPTFLHELGGHGGFQSIMDKAQYAELMRQFNDLVKRGHPMALAAKRLAERESNADTQQLEMLPYLLTLAATMQGTNALQKSAVKRLIDKLVSYVKAFVFDKLGVDLNLSPDDMVALAERMVTKAKQNSSADIIRHKYQNTKQWLKAPNGKPSNLTEQQWIQVRTPEFKNWFGDWENDPKNASEVVDQNGEPKVVFHGTANQFTEFKAGSGLLGQGIYLTDNQQTAEMYANIRSNAQQGIVMPLFVNMRKSFKTNGVASRDDIVRATESGQYEGVLHSFENNEFLVALKPNQVKMAIGNQGSFDPNNPDVLFSIQADMEQMLKDLVSNMNKQGLKKAQNQAAFKFKDMLGHLLQGLGRRQLTEIYTKILPQLDQYNNLAAQMDADKNEAGASADELVVRWAKIADEQQLAELMHEATLAKIDPSKPHVAGDSVSRYKQLRDEYQALSPEAQQMYKDARDSYKKHHLDVRNAIKERIMRASINSAKKADLMRQMDDNFFHSLKGVYFPLSRFGKYVVLVRGPQGVVESVNRAETMSEAEALRTELKKQYPYYNVEKVMLDKEFHASRDMVGRGFMTNLFDELDKFGLSTSKQAELEDILGQLYLSSLPDLSWAKHGIHRKGTKGFSQDARRAFAQNMFHGAGYLAKLRYADVMENQLDEMQEYASKMARTDPNYDQPVAQRVIDEMNKRHERLMSPDSHPLSSALTSVGFIYFLGLSPASALVNLLQTALVAYPIMGAKWGFDQSFIELNKAAAQAIKGKNDISKSLTGDELKAYNEAVRRGVIDVTQAQDLAGIAQGEDSGVMWKLRPIMRVASLLFHQAERFNREVTFIAGYRLAKETGAKHDDAFDQAMDVTYKGHFDYSSGNRPRIMQGNAAKVILLFKQFGQNMLYTMLRSAHQSFKAESPKARTEARKALLGILGMHTVFAGTLGLPLVSTIFGLISFLGGGDDDPMDAESEFRNFLASIFGVTAADVMMRGVSRATPWDLSGRVSINNLIIPNVQDGLEGQGLAQASMAAAIGPIGGIITNILRGLQEIGDGHGYRGIETMMPTFLRSILRSGRFAVEGAQDKTGVSIQDEVSTAALIGQFAGFAPSEVRLATEGKSAVYNHKRKLDSRRSELMAQFARAKMNDDSEAANEAWADIQVFNGKNPSRRITKIQAMQSYRARQKRVDTAEHGMVVSRKKREDLDIGSFAYKE